MDVLETQIKDLERMIQADRAALVERESELLELRVDLTAFERQYEARLGTKIRALEAVRDKIRACQQRLDEYWIWGAKGAQHLFGSQYVSAAEQYRQAYQEGDAGFSFASFADQMADLPLTVTDRERLKALFRELCRRFHPDLAQGEAERDCRTEMMAKINAAYTARDLRALEVLSERPDCEETAESEAAEWRVGFLRDTLERIRQRLDAVNQEIEKLVHSELVQTSIEVKLAQRQGRDLLAEMESDLDEAIAESRARLTSLEGELHALGSV